MADKPTLAFFSLACCEGCQLQVLAANEKLLPILERADIVRFREASDGDADHYNVTFLEGSIVTEHDIERAKAIRAKTDVLVALGACATIGGVNVIKNFQESDDVAEYVYGDKKDWFPHIPTRPLKAEVQVDVEIHGCPINTCEFLEVAKCLLMGKPYRQPNYPVCVPCKLAGNVCLWHKGVPCLGVVTRAGCEPFLCPSAGHKCIGCRGLVDNPNTEAAADVMAEFGLTVEEVFREFSLFQGIYDDVAKMK
ncbi:MAG: NADH:ubiquinone oxidoreductase [Planctomycetes bacterium]|nr:NADH:ubiquinone oxidoreductase [Planctomycetota bacterium]